MSLDKEIGSNFIQIFNILYGLVKKCNSQLYKYENIELYLLSPQDLRLHEENISKFEADITNKTKSITDRISEISGEFTYISEHDKLHKKMIVNNLLLKINNMTLFLQRIEKFKLNIIDRILDVGVHNTNDGINNLQDSSDSDDDFDKYVFGEKKLEEKKNEQEILRWHVKIRKITEMMNLMTEKLNGQNELIENIQLSCEIRLQQNKEANTNLTLVNKEVNYTEVYFGLIIYILCLMLLLKL